MIAASSTAYQAVSRARIGSSHFAPARSRRRAPCGSAPAAERALELLAQVADVDVDDVGRALVARRPRRAPAAAARDTTSPACRARKWSSANSRAVSSTSRPGTRSPTCRAGSTRRSPTSMTGGRSDGLAADQRAQAREQLAEVERLHQVVVGACVEPADPVLHLVSRREHQHRHPVLVAPQLPADGEPVRPGSITSSTTAS